MVLTADLTVAVIWEEATGKNEFLFLKLYLPTLIIKLKFLKQNIQK